VTSDAAGSRAGAASSQTPQEPTTSTVAPTAAPDETRIAEPAASAPAPADAEIPAVRRGLPRVPGGEPWPPASFVPRIAVVVGADQPAPTAVERDVERDVVEPVDAGVPVAASTAVAPAGPKRDLSVPLPFTPTVFPGPYAFAHPGPAPEPTRYGPFTRLQWAGAVIVGGIGLLFAAAMVVLAARWLVSLEGVRDFLHTYPGEYHLPETAPVGLPAWVGWQHFFNVFLMVLIIRSGLQVRHEKRPPAFWTPRWNTKRKISLALWFHQSLDILWLVNGVVFVVLLFVTGQWMRLVPTSWEVFPNALSAALQYVSLNWPTENGWVNYNALQQLAYFATVFVAAPLAAITGVRMSGLWPSRATTLSRVYPVEWARAVHYPVMLYFVGFIIVHVALVLATGALRNLNHMYAAQDVVNWTGFWIFVASMVLIAAAWVASRPLVLAPIAKLFGSVSAR
jgi:thiosulfate reductase cytochrome b subunit